MRTSDSLKFLHARVVRACAHNAVLLGVLEDSNCARGPEGTMRTTGCCSEKAVQADLALAFPHLDTKCLPLNVTCLTARTVELHKLLLARFAGACRLTVNILGHVDLATMRTADCLKALLAPFVSTCVHMAVFVASVLPNVDLLTMRTADCLKLFLACFVHMCRRKALATLVARGKIPNPDALAMRTYNCPEALSTLVTDAYVHNTFLVSGILPRVHAPAMRTANCLKGFLAPVACACKAVLEIRAIVSIDLMTMRTVDYKKALLAGPVVEREFKSLCVTTIPGHLIAHASQCGQTILVQGRTRQGTVRHSRPAPTRTHMSVMLVWYPYRKLYISPGTVRCL